MSDVALLGLDYLAFADGLVAADLRAQADARQTALLNTIVRGALVASGNYEEKVLFEDYFPAPEIPDGIATTSDADVDLDYSGVDFGTPDESEMEILQRMLADTMVTVSGVDGADESEAPASGLPAPREIALADIEQDREWV